MSAYAATHPKYTPRDSSTQVPACVRGLVTNGFDHSLELLFRALARSVSDESYDSRHMQMAQRQRASSFLGLGGVCAVTVGSLRLYHAARNPRRPSTKDCGKRSDSL